MLHEFRRAGMVPAYSSIVGGGANGCVLHYTENNAALQDGDLLLIDAGAEYDCYASDVTRTFPVNGRFSAAHSHGTGRPLGGNICDDHFQRGDQARHG